MVGTLLSGYPWLESGWANSSSTGPLTPYNGAADGTPMPGGQNFAAFLHALQSGGRLPRGMAGAPGAAGYPPISLRAPGVGVGGVPGVMGDQAARAMAMGLQIKINKHLQALGPRSTGVNSAGLSGSLVNMVRQASARHGWSGTQVQDWLNVINAESGGSLTITNPSSGAYGLAQFIQGPSEYYTYGGDPHTMAGEVTAMGNYIAQRWHTPAAAWANEQSQHWYSRGGRWGGWNAAGGSFVTHGPTVFGAGERGPERVNVTPLKRGGAGSASGGHTIHVHITGPVNFGGTRDELDATAQYVANKILDALDGASSGTDAQLMGASS
jgi:hypothetical protein